VAKAVSAATSAAVPASVHALVKGVTASLAIKKAKVVVAIFFAFGALVGTTSMWAFQQQPGGQEKAPMAQAATKQDAAVKAEPAVAKDIYGDSLPGGAVARLGAARFRHEGVADDLTFNPDGKTLLAHTQSGVVLWDLTTGREYRRLPVPRPVPRASALSQNYGMAVSPDGRNLAIAETRLLGQAVVGQISLWDLHTGTKTRTLRLPDVITPKVTKVEGKGIGRGPLRNHVFFVLDGNGLITLAGARTEEQKALVFDVASGQVRFSLGSGSPYGIGECALSPDGKILAVSTYPKVAVQLWNIATGKLIRTVYENAQVSKSPRPQPPPILAYSPDGKVLASAVLFRGNLFDLATGEQLGTIESQGDLISGLAFTPDSKNLICVASKGLAIRDATSGRMVREWKFATPQQLKPGSPAVSADGKIVALPGLESTAVGLWDVATGKNLFTDEQGHEAPVTSLAFSPDGKTLASADDGGQVILWDSARKTRIVTVSLAARALAFSPSGKRLSIVEASQKYLLSSGQYVAKQNKPDPAVHLWDVDPAKESLKITVPDAQYISSAEFSPDGNKLVTLDWNKSRKAQYQVRQWDIATGKQDRDWAISYRDPEVKKSRLGPPPLLGGSSTPAFPHSLARDGTKVFGAIAGDGISVYSVESGRKRTLASIEKADGLSFALSPDARLLASWIEKPLYPEVQAGIRPIASSLNSMIQLCDVITGKEIALLKGNQGTVVVAAWSNDGRLVASGERRADPKELTELQTVRLWDAATGKQLACFGDFKVDVTALSFAPDAKSLAAGLRDGTILIWDVSKADPKAMPSANLDKQKLESCWSDLIGEDTTKAHQVIGTLTLSPKESVPFLRGRLRPAPVLDAEKIAKWIADQDSPTLAVRQAAKKALENAIGQAVMPIQETLKTNVSLEARLRLVQILNALDVPSPDTLRTIRAIMTLERIGSPDAQAVLQKLASGAPGARETEEAKTSLERLKQRASNVR
jgi:WD40 repeat protein